jgi:glycosyltransferase involved in cell wall biosynthesis
MGQVTQTDNDKSLSSDTFKVESISVASPAYNEAEGIEHVVGHWIEYLRGIPQLQQFEIVVCNDGSRDDTGAILDRLAAQSPELKPIHSARNQGAGAALRRAIQHTTGDWVLLLDSDGQFPIENLLPMVEAVESRRVLCATGVRAKKDHWFARFGSWSSSVTANLFHGTRYRDFNSIFKLVHGPLLRSLNLEANGLSCSTELTSKLLERGITLAEVEIEHQARTTGKSSMKLVRDSTHRLLFVLYIGFRQLLLRTGVLRTNSD